MATEIQKPVIPLWHSVRAATTHRAPTHRAPLLCIRVRFGGLGSGSCGTPYGPPCGPLVCVGVYARARRACNRCMRARRNVRKLTGGSLTCVLRARASN